MADDKALRAQLVKLLDFKEAHVDFDQAVKGIPPAAARQAAARRRAHVVAAGRAPADCAGRHPRVLQTAKYKEKKWPDDYWPKALGPHSAAAWNKSIASTAAIARRCSGSRQTRRSICWRRFRTAPARPTCASSCSSPTTTGITSARSSPLRRRPGQLVVAQAFRPASHGHRSQRLRTQRLIGPGFATPVDAVRWFGAVQAQDYAGALWALGLRTTGATEASVEQAIAERTIVRSWPLRGTLHFAAADDLRWMLQRLRAGDRSRAMRAAAPPVRARRRRLRAPARRSCQGAGGRPPAVAAAALRAARPRRNRDAGGTRQHMLFWRSPTTA